MKRLLSLIGAIFIVSSLPLRAIASSNELPDYIEQCLADGANQRALRGGRALEIDVFSRFNTQDETYLQAIVVTKEPNSWSFIVKYTDESCEFVGDDFVNEIGLFGDTDKSIVKEWTIQNLERRLQEVKKNEIRDAIKSSSIQWHPGQIEAFKEMDLM